MSAQATAPASAAGHPSPGSLRGQAVIFDTPYDMGAYVEVVDRHAFRNLFQDGDLSQVALLRDHDSSQLLARVGAQTLHLEVTGTGLDFTAVLPDTQLARDTLALCARGDLGQCSFGFSLTRPGGDEWREGTDYTGGRPVRVLKSFSRLRDVAVVSYPASPTTWVKVRSADVADVVDADERSRRVERHRRVRPAPYMDPELVFGPLAKPDSHRELRALVDTERRELTWPPAPDMFCPLGASTPTRRHTPFARRPRRL